MARVAASPNILLIGRSLVTKPPREEYIREGRGGDIRKKRRDSDTVEQFGCVFRRSAVICLPAATMRVLFLSLFPSPPLRSPPPFPAFLRLSAPVDPLPPSFSISRHFLPRLTRGALPTCQRYIFCRPTNRLAGNFEIGTLI